METNWTLVIALWVGLLAAILICSIPELRKTPEQRKKEGEMVREMLAKDRAERKRKRREAAANAPAKGCLQSMLERWFAFFLLIVAVILSIIVLG